MAMFAYKPTRFGNFVSKQLISSDSIPLMSVKFIETFYPICEAVKKEKPFTVHDNVKYG